MTTTRSLLLVVLLLWGSLPYSVYSETVNGTTGNVTTNGLNWDMLQYLPPEAGLTVNLIHYEYTVTKIREDDFTVTIANQNALGSGNIFTNTDDWSGLSGNTIDRILPVANIPRKFWGDGSLTTTGNGNISDVNIKYSFTFDNCIDPNTNPECPQPAKDILLPLIENPYDSDEVQTALETKVEEEEDVKKEDEENNDDEDKRRKLANDNNPLMSNAARLAVLFDQMAFVPKFDSYYDVEIQGGTYEDAIELKDVTLPDNKQGFKSLAEDKKFNAIVRSQYIQ